MARHRRLRRNVLLAGRAVELLGELVSRLEVDADRMRANLEASGGAVLSEAVMLALAPHIGRDAAHCLMYELAIACRAQGRSLIEAVRADPTIAATLDARVLEPLLDLSRQTGHCAAMVEQVLAGNALP